MLRRGVTRVALRFTLRCLCLSLSGASVRGRADCAKKTASGLRRQPMSRRLVPLVSEHHHSTHPRSRRAGPRQKNARISIQYTGTCNLARPPVHHRPPFRSCRVCSRPCHVLPSCTRNSPSRAACVWHGDSAVSSAWDAINIENIHAQLAGWQAIRLPNARNSSVGC